MAELASSDTFMSTGKDNRQLVQLCLKSALLTVTNWGLRVAIPGLYPIHMIQLDMVYSE